MTIPLTVSDFGDAYLFRGDCLESMRALLDMGSAGQVDAVVTDPPYGIAFAGETWDSPETIAFREEVWRLAFRLLRPGGQLVAFSSARTYHRLATAVEAAGFEIRDQLMWLYRTGVPVSRDVSRDIDAVLGVTREPKRIPFTSAMGNTKARSLNRPFMRRAAERGYHEMPGDVPVTPEAVAWNGYGSALKPAHEPMVLARKPLEGSLARNVLMYGTGAINVDGCRYHASKGEPRHPGNVLYDGCAEVVAAFPVGAGGKSAAANFQAHAWEPEEADRRRAYYCRKASKVERGGSQHPTQKPLALMQWLVRLLCPPGGNVLDPFAGSGTTMEAALLEGRCALGCKLTPDYWPDVETRVLRALAATGRDANSNPLAT